MLLVIAAIGLGVAGVAWAATRPAVAITGGSRGQQHGAAPVDPPGNPLDPVNTNSNATPVDVGPTTGAAPGNTPNGNDLLALAGKVGGLVAGESAFTNTGKALALPVGVGVATVAMLAGAGASLSVAAIWATPVLVLTVAIVTIIDAIARTEQADRWRKGVVEVRDLRAAGKFREAREVHAAMIDQISVISRVSPQPHEDWFNHLAPYGRIPGEPYPGFPGPPAPATAAELALNPSQRPGSIATTNGQTVNIARLLEAAAKDIHDARAWGLKNGAPGELPIWAGPVELGRSETDATRPLKIVTVGPRDISKWPPLADRVRNASRIQISLQAALPWLDGGCFPLPVPVTTPEEAAVAAFRAVAKKTEDARRAKIQTKQSAAIITGGQRVSSAQAAAIVAAERRETQGDAAATTAARAQASRSTEADRESGGGTSGNRRPANNSGSGGRNA